jgi:hypothetical protein
MGKEGEGGRGDKGGMGVEESSEYLGKDYILFLCVRKVGKVIAWPGDRGLLVKAWRSLTGHLGIWSRDHLKVKNGLVVSWQVFEGSSGKSGS